jgi:hypothetical protein
MRNFYSVLSLKFKQNFYTAKVFDYIDWSILLFIEQIYQYDSLKLFNTFWLTHMIYPVFFKFHSLFIINWIYRCIYVYTKKNGEETTSTKMTRTNNDIKKQKSFSCFDDWKLLTLWLLYTKYKIERCKASKERILQ